MIVKKLVWLLLAAMLLVGCGAKNDEHPADSSKPTDIVINTEKQEDEQEDKDEESEDKTEQDTSNDDKTEDATENDSQESQEGPYDVLLNKVYDLMVNSPEVLLNEEGLSGIYDLIRDKAIEDALSTIGYKVEDISGDGIPEMMLGYVPDGKDGKGTGSMVVSLFTQLNGEPKLVLEGYYKNRYDWMGDGKFYYFGSGGAIYAMFGTYKLEGTELKCEDYYFTYKKGESFEEIGHYHNTSGEWDVSVSEEIPENDFWGMESELAQDVKDIEWNTFTGYVME